MLPTLGWAGEETFDISFCAVEEETPVVISTIGCQKRQEEFLLGFNEMKKRLNPPIIIVVGDMIQGMTGRFINFRYTDSFATDFVQMKFDGISAVFEIKEAI